MEEFSAIDSHANSGSADGATAEMAPPAGVPEACPPSPSGRPLGFYVAAAVIGVCAGIALGSRLRGSESKMLQSQVQRLTAENWQLHEQEAQSSPCADCAQAETLRAEVEVLRREVAAVRSRVTTGVLDAQDPATVS